MAGCNKVGVLIVSFRARELDQDNLSGGSKAVIDALRYSGYLVDDNQASIKTFYQQRKCTREQEHTEIYIFPWEDGDAPDPAQAVAPNSRSTPGPA